MGVLRHRFDVACGCRELHSVEITAAPNSESFALAGDATASSKEHSELASVWITSAFLKQLPTSDGLSSCTRGGLAFLRHLLGYALLDTVEVSLQHRVAVVANSVPVFAVVGIQIVRAFPVVGHTVVVGVVGGSCAG